MLSKVFEVPGSKLEAPVKEVESLIAPADHDNENLKFPRVRGFTQHPSFSGALGMVVGLTDSPEGVRYHVPFTGTTNGFHLHWASARSWSRPDNALLSSLTFFWSWMRKPASAVRTVGTQTVITYSWLSGAAHPRCTAQSRTYATEVVTM